MSMICHRDHNQHSTAGKQHYQSFILLSNTSKSLDMKKHYYWKEREREREPKILKIANIIMYEKLQERILR
jgi:hypothetical protein